MKISQSTVPVSFPNCTLALSLGTFWEWQWCAEVSVTSCCSPMCYRVNSSEQRTRGVVVLLNYRHRVKYDYEQSVAMRESGWSMSTVQLRAKQSSAPHKSSILLNVAWSCNCFHHHSKFSGQNPTSLFPTEARYSSISSNNTASYHMHRQ